MEPGQAALLRDLLAVYDMQIVSMVEATKEGKAVTASLHERMAKNLLETYFDLVEKVLD